MSSTTTSLSEYWQMCHDHDWTYMMSDDHRAWKRGQEAQNQLLRISKQSEDHFKMYQGWMDYMHKRSTLPPEKPKDK